MSYPNIREGGLPGAYPEEYTGAKPIEEQVAIWNELIPGIGNVDPNFLDGDLVDGSEGFFVKPKWRSLPGNTYGSLFIEAIHMLMDHFGDDFIRTGFHDELLEDQRRYATTDELQLCWQEVEKNQSGNLTVFQAQFGKRYIGNGIYRRATSAEFPLDGVTIAHMLLTHPERALQIRDRALHMYCGPDTYADPEYPSKTAIPMFVCAKGTLFPRLAEYTIGGNKTNEVGTPSGFLL